MEQEIKVITINFSNIFGSGAWNKGGCMWERQILDNFATRWQIKLNECPRYVSGNFIVLNEWMLTSKEFNKNPENQRLAFFDDLKKVCKRNKISYTEGNYGR